MNEALTHAMSALRELDNIRWNDIWQRLGGEDDLARWSQKYVGYVRKDLQKTIAALGT